MELKIFCIAFIVIVLSGCTYDKEEELFPSLECMTSDMSYANDIAPIIMTNCFGCHSAALNFGNITLEGYAKTKESVDSGSLVGTINHEPGYSPMPKDRAKLIECEIEKIVQWIADGALNN